MQEYSRFKLLTDAVITIIIAAICIAYATLLLSEYTEFSDFLTTATALTTTPVPIPFWVVLLMGVASSITFYRTFVNRRARDLFISELEDAAVEKETPAKDE